MSDDAPPPRWIWPKLRLAGALYLLALLIAICATQTLGIHAAITSRGGTESLGAIFVSYLTGTIAVWIASPIPHAAVLNAPDPRKRGWLRVFGVHIAAYLLFWLVHVVIMIGLRLVVLAFAGHDDGFFFGSIASQMIYELQNDLVVYPALAGVWYAYRSWEERREAALRAARLEAALVETRLATLSNELDPHFLFNALHTVSSVMYHDVPRTERLVANLGEILRTTLDATERPTWTLAEERAHTERYQELLEARFEDRLCIHWNVEHGVDAIQVPRFSVQTLVENAVKHNHDETELRIEVDIRIAAGALRITVDDDGRGFAASASERTRTNGRSTHKHGLSRLEETLRLVYGPTASLERGDRRPAGARVTLRFPVEAAA
jgi:two-component system LytT family sensor kinase